MRRGRHCPGGPHARQGPLCSWDWRGGRAGRLGQRGERWGRHVHGGHDTEGGGGEGAGERGSGGSSSTAGVCAGLLGWARGLVAFCLCCSPCAGVQCRQVQDLWLSSWAFLGVVAQRPCAHGPSLCGRAVHHSITGRPCPQGAWFGPRALVLCTNRCRVKLLWYASGSRTHQGPHHRPHQRRGQRLSSRAGTMAAVPWHAPWEHDARVPACHGARTAREHGACA